MESSKTAARSRAACTALRSALATNLRARMGQTLASPSRLAMRCQVARSHLYAVLGARTTLGLDLLDRLAVGLETLPPILLCEAALPPQMLFSRDGRTSRENLAANLRRLLADESRSCSAVAAASNTSPSTWYRALGADSNVPVDWVAVIAASVGSTAAALILPPASMS
jgi:hypothetical protein